MVKSRSKFLYRHKARWKANVQLRLLLSQLYWRQHDAGLHFVVCDGHWDQLRSSSSSGGDGIRGNAGGGSGGGGGGCGSSSSSSSSSSSNIYSVIEMMGLKGRVEQEKFKEFL